MCEAPAPPRRTARAPAAAPFRLRHAEAPPLWHVIAGHAESCSVKRAHAALAAASADDAAALAASRFSAITPIVRAAGEQGKSPAVRRAAEPALLAYVQLALQRGVRPDATCPNALAWELWSPPLVSAAGYGFVTVLAALLEAGAAPAAVNSDGECALHAAIEQPHAMRFLLEASAELRAAASTATTKFGRSAALLALTATPQKPAHVASLELLLPHWACSDDDFRALRVQRKLPRLLRLAERAAAAAAATSARTRSELASAGGSARLWRPSWHNTFPASDRFAMALTHALAARGHGALPPELWVLVFGWCERGWFVTELHAFDFDQRACVAVPPRLQAELRAKAPS